MLTEKDCIHQPQATDMGESHAAGNVIVLAFAFMMLVLVSLYTAVTCERVWLVPDQFTARHAMCA